MARSSSVPLFSKALLAVAALSICGCATPRPFPAVDLASTGWQTRTGQAIWRPERAKPEIVGDLIVATHPVQGGYIQFSKALPIAEGQVRNDAWQIEFPPQNKRYAGRGSPPKQIVWLQLLAMLKGSDASANWRIEKSRENEWLMEERRTGERLEVHF
jgi:hypothetical protein